MNLRSFCLALLLCLMPLKVFAAPDSQLGQQILQEVQTCVLGKVKPSKTPPSRPQLLAASQQCYFSVILFDKDGKQRTDAEQRTEALMAATGVSLPKHSGRGQATVALKRVSPAEKTSQVLSVPVRIAGKTRRFLLDTGASNTIIGSGIAKELHLAGFDIPASLFSEGVIGTQCSKSNLKVAAHMLPAVAVQNALVENLIGMSLPANRIPGGLSGVLGLDFLSSFDVVLDPQIPQLQLLPPSPSEATDIPLDGHSGVLTAPVVINGQNFVFALDTGADVIVVSKQVAKKLALRPTSQKTVSVLGFCGTEQVYPVALKEVTIGKNLRKNLDGLILTSSLLERLGIDGIIGQNFLTQFRQHWHFAPPTALGTVSQGSIELKPIADPK
ncbi:MAG: clan AA aspartic protease [Anaerolineae bacterium]|nr:clan AA aspartic protease [Gloeobacterales cyanobacterium ES-bin-313]